jgi:hypothetical protein
MAEKKIDPRWLKGLKYHSADTKIVEKNGRKTLQAIPTDRAATENDILNWKEYPDKIVIVLKDGMKYKINKDGDLIEPKPKEEPKQESRQEKQK